MFASAKLAINFAIFAPIATVANIRAQDFVIHMYSTTFDLLASAVAGICVGLVVEHVLNRRDIFYFGVRSVVHDTHTFALYATMGIVITVVFWCFKFVFHYTSQIKGICYFGGIISLAIGYLMNCRFDRHYVFHRETL